MASATCLTTFYAIVCQETLEVWGLALPLEDYIIPPDYEALFRQRLVIITGVGRSGTTILGKLLGSLRPAFYLFEPALMRLLPFLLHAEPRQQETYATVIRAVLFEDYFLQAMHGRSLNFNPRDDSYYGNALSLQEVEEQWRVLSRRQDVLRQIQERPPLFALKIPEFQPLFSTASRIAAGTVLLHIIRNGNDVIASSLKRGWYSDAFLKEGLIEWVRKPVSEQECPAPWYLDSESSALFPRWNQETRAASIWRQLTAAGLDYAASHPTQCISLQYEEFARAPEAIAERVAGQYGLETTEITRRHLSAVAGFSPSSYPSAVARIQEPERARFLALMKDLGYAA